MPIKYIPINVKPFPELIGLELLFFASFFQYIFLILKELHKVRNKPTLLPLISGNTVGFFCCLITKGE